MPSSYGDINEEQDDDEEFKQFDVVSDDVKDHSFYYINWKEPMGSETTKKIMKEWKTLEESLPRGSIFVRGFETRIDLVRAVIVGAKGTPYHNGLYFFDVQFPPDYPNNPPDLRYRSYGYRMNPNLYQDGRVCLSLLGTWFGQDAERWNPQRSTLLQVLVSIQALVLNEKPYYNEPTLITWAWYENSSLKYNENIFALACITGLHLLKKKPRNFEGFVVRHYGERAEMILEACRAYYSGRVRVGYYGATSLVRSNSVSKKFKKEMETIYTRLVRGFEENGIRVREDLVDLGVVINNNNGINARDWFIDFIRKCFSCVFSDY